MESRKLAVIMFTDMVGYSKKIHENEEQALRLLGEHNEVLRAQIEAYQGNVIKTIGDAFMADFDSVFNAVNCAVDIQKKLDEINADESREKIEVRIGIHVGDVIYRDNDVFGDGVNIASRIEAEAGGGQIFISHDVFSITYGKLDYHFKDIGSKELKNIERPVHVYEVLWDPARAQEATKLPPIVPRSPRKKIRSKKAVAAAVVVLAVVALLVGVKFLAKDPEIPRKPRLAIVSFSDETNDENLQRMQIGKIVNNAVMQKFYEFPHVQLVSPLQIAKVKKELDIQDVNVARDPNLAAKIARETNGQLLISGALNKLGDKIILSADLNDLEPEQEKLIATFSMEEDSEERILGLLDSLCTKFQNKYSRCVCVSGKHTGKNSQYRGVDDPLARSLLALCPGL